MEVKLYVGNMTYSTTEEQLRTLFSEAGNVVTVDIIKDRATGRAKGFAFVTMGSQAEADNAISVFNGKEVGGRALTVNVAKPREERPGGGGRSFNGPNRRGGQGGRGGPSGYGGRGGQNDRGDRGDRGGYGNRGGQGNRGGRDDRG
ncbi:MAG: RNA-binding protein [Anaerolineaceae bacterium]|nr:RNA-binding protein [Anaerolineaceae bacterium]